jgi:hypothetical protein
MIQNQEFYKMNFQDFKVYFLNAGSILIVSVNTLQTYLQIAVAGISIFYTGLRIFQIIKQNGKDNK